MNAEVTGAEKNLGKTSSVPRFNQTRRLTAGDNMEPQANTATHERAGEAILSLVVPCKNEEQVLLETHRRLTQALSAIDHVSFEIIYVDDGSQDSTPEALRKLHRDDKRVRVVRLSRNFGHQVAITAGMEYASGDAVVVIDADLQDPPEVIAEFVAQWRQGYDVAFGVRTERDGESAFKLWTAKLFYRFIAQLSETEIPLDAGDFRLMDRKVVEALLAMPERDRFIRGMVSWLGFSQVAVPYRREPRLAGKTKFSLLKMVRFATDGVVSFSTMPLRVATYLGFVVSGIAVVGILVALYARLFARNWVQGWTSIVIAVLFLGGVQLICLGIIGEYVGRIYGETKRRPLYFVRELIGFERMAQDYETRIATREERRDGAEPECPEILRFPAGRFSAIQTNTAEASATVEPSEGKLYSKVKLR
jgi:glycosyltransferase involved in cell wall biosynthesis